MSRYLEEHIELVHQPSTDDREIEISRYWNGLSNRREYAICQLWDVIHIGTREDATEVVKLLQRLIDDDEGVPS